MKIFLSLILFSIGINAKVAWNCSSVPYDTTQVKRLPERAEIKIELKEDKRGSTEVSLSPDIFEEFANQKFSLKSFFGSSEKPTYAVQSDSCVNEFKSNLELYFAQNKKAFCNPSGRNCLSPEDTISRIEKKITNSIKKGTKDLSPLPRYYTAHALGGSKYSSSVYKEALKNFCSDRPVDPVLMSSRNMIQYTVNIAANPLTSVSKACLEKVDKFNKKNQLITNCDSRNYVCALIKEDAKTYKNRFSKIKEARVEALAHEKDQLNWSAYRLAKSDQAIKIAKSIKELTYTPDRGCVRDYTFPDSNSTPSIFFYDDAIAEALPYIKSNYNNTCKKDFLRNYLLNKSINEDPALSAHCKGASCEQVKEAKKTFNQNIQELVEDIYGSAALQNVCIQKPNVHDDQFEYESFLNELQSVSACSELKQGEPKLVAGNLLGPSAHYTLERINDKTLKAKVAVDFIDGLANTSVTSDELFKKTKECLAGASTYMRSPSGEVLNIEVIGKSEQSKLPRSQRPQVNPIKIMPKGYRSNDMAYKEDIDCATITHEILHLMGLVDEYKETINKAYVDVHSGKLVPAKSQQELERLLEAGDIKMIDRYQCRAVSTSDSIMRNQWDKLGNTIGTQVTCGCEKLERQDGNSNCQEMTSHPDPKVAKMYTGSIWNGLSDKNSLCTYERIYSSDGVRFQSAVYGSDLANYPMHKIISQTKDEIIFEHTELKLPEIVAKLTYPEVYRYTCSGCKNEKECNELEKLRQRVSNKTVYPYNYCPFGSKEISKKIIPAGEKTQPNTQFGGMHFILTSPSTAGENASLLHPAQFARIKHGVCEDKVKNYNSCAKFAQKDRDPEDCPDKPAFCEDEKKWLMSQD